MNGNGRGQKWLILGLAGVLILGSSACGRKRTLIEDNQMLYNRALEQIERRKFLEAIRALGDMGGLAPVAESLDPMQKLALADAYFHQGGELNIVEAQSRYENFLNFYPLHPKASYARFQIGVCLMEQAESPQNDQEFARRALQHFTTMVKDLKKDDLWLDPARVMKAKAQDRLAEHEWLVAKFYEEKKFYNGAIGRYQTIIDGYPEAHRREEAFFQIGVCYRQLGDVAQARLNFNRLLSEYPSGTLAGPTRNALAALDGQSPPAPDKKRSRRHRNG